MLFHSYTEQWLLLGLSQKEFLTYNVLNANGKGNHSSQSALAYVYDENSGLPAQPQTETSQGWMIWPRALVHFLFLSCSRSMKKIKGGERFFFSGRLPWAWDLFSIFPFLQCPSYFVSSLSQLSVKACPSSFLLWKGFGETNEVHLTLRASITVHIFMYLSDSGWSSF